MENLFLRGVILKTSIFREKFFVSNCAPVFQGVWGRCNVGGGLRRGGVG
jgi:hypothetical protein